MEVTPGIISLRDAIEINRQEDAELAAEEKTKELAAGLSAAAASLQAPEQIMPGAGVVMQGIAAMPMPGVHRPVEFDPEINTKLLAKVAIYQEQQQAQFFAQAYEQKQRGEQLDEEIFEDEVQLVEEKTVESEQAEQQDTRGHSGFLNGLLQAASQSFEKIGSLRIGESDGGSTLWKTHEDKGGETVLQQVLSSIKGSK